MRFTAVRRSVTCLPERFSMAEFDIFSSLAARAGSEPTMRTTWSTVEASSASARLLGGHADVTVASDQGLRVEVTLPLD
jgi:hypothetical protein